MHYGSRLRTTKAYWKSRCGELLDMVNQLGTPTVFFTLSSADFTGQIFTGYLDMMYEYQHRGAIHCHGIAWFKDAPVIKVNMNEEEMQVVTDVYNNLISCQNPDIHIKPNLTHPCQMSLHEIENLEEDLHQLINHV
ncbi:hypothetical protein FOCC_FOCC015233 [Frankliniella occidentalis]|nr:hypothetical protein FOCC_FOCC015233 [Frankliniella occidentalis]